MQPGHAAWNGGAAALQPDQRKQGQRADRVPQAAKRPHTYLGQCDRHDRPAQAPDKSQEHEQQLGLGDFVQSVRRGHEPPLRDKLEARWRVRMRARCETLVQSRPTNLWRRRATFINTSTREARRASALARPALDPAGRKVKAALWRRMNGQGETRQWQKRPATLPLTTMASIPTLRPGPCNFPAICAGAM